jgi:hypothetical protein
MGGSEVETLREFFAVQRLVGDERKNLIAEWRCNRVGTVSGGGFFAFGRVTAAAGVAAGFLRSTGFGGGTSGPLVGAPWSFLR